MWLVKIHVSNAKLTPPYAQSAKLAQIYIKTAVPLIALQDSKQDWEYVNLIAQMDATVHFYLIQIAM